MLAVTYTISVRALCEFTAKHGDLDLRFTPSPSAQEGMEGHSILAARRRAADQTAGYEKARYEKEVPLEGQYEDLQVRGRADGFDPETQQLEEFKTYRGSLDRMPENHRAMHWAQLRIYGALLCRSRELAGVKLALVYFDVVSQQETVLVEHHSAESLEQYFAKECERFIDWARKETAHRIARNAALTSLRFPFPTFHAGQRQLAESVYRTIRRGSALLAQAPTGIGKTIGTLFPALKAMPGEGLDRIFCLVAKTPGRRIALDALARIAPGPLRVLELVAREKSCEHPDRECHGQSCPLARGFYDRLPAARAAAVERATLDSQSVRETALAHDVCPYYLGQELTRWADVVVGDFNYYFDATAPLYALTVQQKWKVCVLVDEAHNLLERARKMYSASLQRSAFDAAQSVAPVDLKRAFAGFARDWDDLVDSQTGSYCVLDHVPESLLRSLERCVAALTDFLAEHPLSPAPELLEFYFEAARFARLALELDDDTLFDVAQPEEGAWPITGSITGGPTGRSTQSTLCLRNVTPGKFLAPRWAAARATVLYSATLSPPEFHRQVLGLPAQTARTDVESPFSPEQLTVRLVHSISTRFRDRARSIDPIAHLMAEQYSTRPGNYLAFFASFDYLRQVAEYFEARHPQIPVWRQQRSMPERERQEFMDRFVPGGRGVGFAVLGGAFAEGIDLTGDRLIGAFIATLGLPQINPINEEMQRRMQLKFGAGYEYTYLYPGLQKVVQAAGRVIRTPEDRGIVYLIDDRFTQTSVRRLLPTWWTTTPLAFRTSAP